MFFSSRVSRNSFNKNLSSPPNNGFESFVIFQLHSSSFDYMQSKECGDISDYGVYRIVKEGVGDAAEARDGTGCTLDPHMIRGKLRLLCLA